MKEAADLLNDPDPETVRQTLLSLLSGPAPIRYVRLVAAVLDRLADGPELVRFWASEVLTDKVSGADCGPLVPRLLRALGDPDPAVRRRLLRLLEDVPPSRPVLSRVRPHLRDGEPGVRAFALRAAWAHGGSARLVAAHVAVLLREEDAHCLCVTCQLVSRIGWAGKDFTPLLLPLLRHGEGAVRGNGLYALGKHSRDTAAVRAAAASLVADEFTMVRYVANKLTRGSLPDVGT